MGLKITSSAVWGKHLGGEKLLVQPVPFLLSCSSRGGGGEGVGGRETRSGLECLKDQRVLKRKQTPANGFRVG